MPTEEAYNANSMDDPTDRNRARARELDRQQRELEQQRRQLEREARDDRSRPKRVVNIDRSRNTFLPTAAAVPDSDTGWGGCPLRDLTTPGKVVGGAIAGAVVSSLFGKGLVMGLLGGAAVGGLAAWALPTTPAAPVPDDV